MKTNFADNRRLFGAAEKKILFRRIIVRLFVRTPRLRSKAAIWFRPKRYLSDNLSTARNPRTGAEIKVAAKNVAKFKVGKSLQDALN
jgi:hypothetical protein